MRLQLNRTPAYLAASGNRVAAMRVLLECKADIHTPTTVLAFTWCTNVFVTVYVCGPVAAKGLNAWVREGADGYEGASSRVRALYASGM